MRLLTPEIAWHETLPIYSCDLQHTTYPALIVNQKEACRSNRTPLSEVTDVTVPREGDKFNAPNDIVPHEWIRLATAGGDNVVRLWRVRLGWTAATTVQNSATNPSLGVQKKRAVHSNLTEQLTYLASLKRHEKPVNVVRWSPSGFYLASAGDDLFIIIWANQDYMGTSNGSTVTDEPMLTRDEQDEDERGAATEHWLPCRRLRRHLEDIYDVCWSPDSRNLVSGSVDHSVIFWQLDLATPVVAPAIPGSDSASTTSPSKAASTNGSSMIVGPGGDQPTPAPLTPSTGAGNTKYLILRDHKHYVQGVTWDPLGFYVASLSSDRACRVYRAGSRNCLAHVSKAGKQRLFQDDSWKSFFRRLTFSPDGLLLACPAGNLEDAQFAGSVNTNATPAATAANPGQQDSAPIPTVAPQHAAHLFLRTQFTRPIVSLPTGSRPVVTIRFCPQPFQLRRTTGSGQSEAVSTRSLFDLPYRWVFCLVLEDGILFYDTQQSSPFAQVSNCHYQALNDATWSKDGHLVVTCSTDGYCSLIHFARGELGAPYHGPIGEKVVRSRPVQENDVKTTEPQPAPKLEQSVVSSDVHPPSPGKEVTATTENKPLSGLVACGLDCPAPVNEKTTPIKQSHAVKKPLRDTSSTAIASPQQPTDNAKARRRVALTTLTTTDPLEEPSIQKPTPTLAVTIPMVTDTSPLNTSPDQRQTDEKQRKRRVSFVTLGTAEVAGASSSSSSQPINVDPSEPEQLKDTN